MLRTSHALLCFWSIIKSESLFSRIFVHFLLGRPSALFSISFFLADLNRLHSHCRHPFCLFVLYVSLHAFVRLSSLSPSFLANFESAPSSLSTSTLPVQGSELEHPVVVNNHVFIPYTTMEIASCCLWQCIEILKPSGCKVLQGNYRSGRKNNFWLTSLFLILLMVEFLDSSPANITMETLQDPRL